MGAPVGPRTKYGRYWRNTRTPRPVGHHSVLSKEDVGLLYFMIDSGLKWREVMEHFNITQPTVNYWLKKRESAAHAPTKEG